MNRTPVLPHPSQRLRVLAAAALLAVAASPLGAVPYCVGNVTELRDAAAAISNSESQFDLRIKSGYYGLTPVQGQTHAIRIRRFWSMDTTGGPPHRISGAWNADCTEQANQVNASNSSVIDGQTLTGTLLIERRNWQVAGDPNLPRPQLQIDRLQLSNSSGRGLQVHEVVIGSVQFWRDLDITVDRVRFDSAAQGGLALAAGGEIYVRNSQFLGNRGFRSAMELSGEQAIHIYNNTLRYNEIISSTFGNGQVGVRTLGTVYVFNNLIADGSYANPAVDLHIEDGNAFVRNNRMVANVVQESPDLLIQSGNTTAIPQFVNAQNPRLLASSPLRDLGLVPAFSLGSLDYDGNTRVQGAAPEMGAFELAPLAVQGPALSYSPTAGASAGGGGPVNFTGVTIVGTSGSGSIVVTPSGGSGGGSTTLSAFTLTGAQAGFFARTSPATLTFAAGVSAAQNVTLSCTAGASSRSANLQATETIAGGATTVRHWVLVCPAGGALGPSLAFNPAPGASAGSGGPVNFSGVSAAGTAGNASITVTPSGGVSAGTTTLSNFTLSGADAAAFQRTSAATLNFTAGLVLSQEIALTCTSGASQRTANLQATENVTGGTTTQRFWVLLCPAGTTSENIFAGGFEN